MDLADASVAQLMIPVENFDAGVSFYKNVLGIPFLFAAPPQMAFFMGATEIRVGQLGINYIVDGSDSGSIGLFELTVPPGSNVPPPHSHSNNEECVYVLAGTLRYTVGAETRDLTPGQCMPLRRGTNDLALYTRGSDQLQLLAVPPHWRPLGLF